MWSRILIYIIGVITGHCYGEKVYTTHCGTVSVAEPAIHGKQVLFTFIPKDQTNVSEGGVKWKYSYGKQEYEVYNSTLYNMMAHNSSFTLDLAFIKDRDGRREYSAVYTKYNRGCQSSWFKLVVLDAPTQCGILYRQPKRIQNADEVIMEYYASNSVLDDGQYDRQLRRKNSTDCEDALGCAVNVTWFEEEYSDYNSVYTYRIRNFTDDMNGNYTLQCTHRTNDNKITNYVRLVIPVSPESTQINILTTATSDRKTFTQTLQCAVINANPACNVNWTYSSTLNVVIGARNETKPEGHGGFTTTSTLQFNGTTNINSQEMYCRAVCDLFNVSSMAKYTILIPYAPNISTNSSKNTNWNVGDTVMIKCYADSFPSANLSWFDTANNTMATSNCGDKAICMAIKNVQMTDAGIYTCMAEMEFFDTVIQTVELAIKPTRNAIKQGRTKEKSTIPWFIVGIAATCLMVVLAVILAVVIVTKRRKRRKIKKANENVSMDVLSQNSKHCGENIGSDIGTYDSIQDVTNANATGDTNATNTDSPSTDDGADYAVVIPKSQRQTQGLRDMNTRSTIQQDNHNLVYADLDLITDGTTTNYFVQPDELSTEYVSIDFNRVGEQLPDIETENIYANQ